MKFFIDIANLAQIQETRDLGVLDGVTTDPSLIAKEGVTDREAIFKHYTNICTIVGGDVSAKVIITDFEGIVHGDEELTALHPQIVVKVPMIEDDIKTIKYFIDKGIRTNCTLVFSAGQTLLVTKTGAAYVLPFVGRPDDISADGLSLIEEICLIYDNYNFETQILAAPMCHTIYILKCTKIGADVITTPLSAITGLLKHPLADSGLAQLLVDAKRLG